LSLPATALTRLAIARHDNHSLAQSTLETRHHETTALLSAYTSSTFVCETRNDSQ
jgi:hypothetical protein